MKSSTSPPHNSQVPAEDTKQALGVSFEGQFFEHSSLARVNREIARGLLASNELELRVETSAPASLPPHMLLGGEDLVDRVHRPVHHINLTIRHQWPPNFRRPPTGKLAVILPWEFGGVPRVWVDRIEGDVDELWVPSEFVRDVFVRNGVGADRVSVIANGYDPKTFSTEGPRFRPEGSRNFVFLFVGGAVPRKGLDLLLDAYKAAFDESEQVTLVLLVSGSSGAYQHNSLTADIQAAVTSLKQPHVLAMFDTIDDAALAALYRGSDAFVLPYRGEGFGMPLLEAMACGKPVITTALGPAKEFCRESNSYLIPASADLVFDPPPLGPIVGSFTWFEPSFLELVKTLRHVYENRGEAVAKGRTAAESVRHLTWQDAASRYRTRIQQLCKPQ